MWIDKVLEFSAAQAVIASAPSTSYVDLGSARDVGMSERLHVCITCDQSATAAGAATVQFQLQDAIDSAFTSPKTVIETDAIPKASLVAGMDPIYLPLPPGLNLEFVRLNYNVATGPLTAGKFTARIVMGIQSAPSYTAVQP